jgi:hypothetical protein
VNAEELAGLLLVHSSLSASGAPPDHVADVVSSLSPLLRHQGARFPDQNPPQALSVGCRIATIVADLDSVLPVSAPSPMLGPDITVGSKEEARADEGEGEGGIKAPLAAAAWASVKAEDHLPHVDAADTWPSNADATANTGEGGRGDSMAGALIQGVDNVPALLSAGPQQLSAGPIGISHEEGPGPGTTSHYGDYSGARHGFSRQGGSVGDRAQGAVAAAALERGQYAVTELAVRCAVLCCAVLCCAVLCCAVLCCAALRCAVLRCAELCCAVLC